jgi:hypothetical protein
MNTILKMSEGGRRRKVRKSESPDDSLKLEVESPKPEANNSAPPMGGSQSELNTSETEHPTSELNKQSKFVNRKSEIEPLTTHNSPLTTMEVHHHPEVEKKGLKEYFFEGLMIFLAVMMGFIAENIRETISDHEHVHQLTSQLSQDIKADITSLDSLYKEQLMLINKDDTLIKILNEPLGTVDKIKLQDLVLYCYTIAEFHPTVGAIGAIKSELHLKEFSNSKLTKYIADYEQTINSVQKGQEVQYQNLREYLQTFFANHFTAYNLDTRAIEHKPLMNAQLRNVTQDDLTQLGAEVEIIKITNYYELAYNRKMKNKAVKLIQYVGKQYNLEE